MLHNRGASVATLRELFAFGSECRSRFLRNQRSPSPESSAVFAHAVNCALRAEGIVTFEQGLSNVLMTDWGLHLYYNNLSLVARRGFPWDLPANEASLRDYSKGACPVADSLFERSILIPVPSCLTQQDEKDIMLAFEKVLSASL